MANSVPRTVPRSPREVLASLAPTNGGSKPEAESAEATLLQDWTPLSRSLEWRLAQFYWASAGVEGFLGGEVPYVVNNTAWVGRAAASVFLAHQENLGGKHEPLLVLELGAGLGLFARHFLDALRSECLDMGRNEYDRVVYFITDGSERTAERWIESDLFNAHPSHVVVGVTDALLPDRVRVIGNAAPLPSHALSLAKDRYGKFSPGAFHAIFANYLFDSLPATILGRGPEATLDELQVRTHLPAAMMPVVRERCGQDPVELAARAASDEESALRELLPFLSLFEFEVMYRPLQETPLHLDQALNFLAEPGQRTRVAPSSAVPDRIVLNFGALDSLEACASLLTKDGILLFRDMGPSVPGSIADHSNAVRFGSSLAISVNFPILESFLAARGFAVASPPGDEARGIHTRLAGRNLAESTRDRFGAVFAGDLHAKADAQNTEATIHIQAGRIESALACYQTAVELCPDDWHLLGNVAQFLTQQMFRFSEAIELAEQAIALNPVFSSFLWNTLGNAHFCLGEHEAAHDAYLRARTIRPQDPQTHLNLAYSLAVRGDFESALLALGTGLACDLDGRFESALLGKQREIVEQVRTNRRAELQRAERRHELFNAR